MTPNPPKPSISRELITWLNHQFPDVSPTLDELRDEKAMAFRAGQVNVVRHLEALLAKQEKPGNVLR